MDLFSRPIFLAGSGETLLESSSIGWVVAAVVGLILPLARLVFPQSRGVSWQLMVVQRWRGRPVVAWSAWCLQAIDLVRVAWALSLLGPICSRLLPGGTLSDLIALALLLGGMTYLQARWGISKPGDYYVPAGYLAGGIFALMGNPWLLLLTIGGGLFLADWFRSWHAFFWGMALVVVLTGYMFTLSLTSIAVLAALASAPALYGSIRPVTLGMPMRRRNVAWPIVVN
jgi:hypothetical protein